jgi:NADH-ubiquinone oxidoreductase chain 2
VYDEVPTIVTTWLTIMPKISILVLFIELQSGFGLNTESLSLIYGYSSFNVFKNLLLLSSLLSLILGTVVGLAQTRIKRLLAYSTISHVGFLLLALAVNTEQSIDSLIFYLIQYSITNLNTFFIILAFGYVLQSTIVKRELGDIRYITEFKGQFYTNPLLSLSLAICLFSMAGT